MLGPAVLRRLFVTRVCFCQRRRNGHIRFKVSSRSPSFSVSFSFGRKEREEEKKKGRILCS